MKIIDMHCDTISRLDKAIRLKQNQTLRSNDFQIDLNKMKESQYMLQNFAIFTSLQKVGDPICHVQHLIDTFYNEIEKNSDMIEAVRSYQEIENHMKNQKMSALLTLEEGAVVNHDLSYLRNYYRLGVRMIALNWNYPNGIGYPNFDMNDASHGYGVYDDVHGLTDFGIEYIRECQRLGIIIDVSHLSDAGFNDVFKYTDVPFVASHSNARSICRHARNMSDDMILRLASRGGVIGINYCADFLEESQDGKRTLSHIEAIVKHILYIKNLAGIDCIGLGSDFDGIEPYDELKDACHVGKLYHALSEAGLSEEEIEKIFYKNVLRVYKEIL